MHGQVLSCANLIYPRDEFEKLSHTINSRRDLKPSSGAMIYSYILGLHTQVFSPFVGNWTWGFSMLSSCSTMGPCLYLCTQNLMLPHMEKGLFSNQEMWAEPSVGQVLIHVRQKDPSQARSAMLLTLGMKKDPGAKEHGQCLEAVLKARTQSLSWSI